MNDEVFAVLYNINSSVCLVMWMENRPSLLYGSKYCSVLLCDTVHCVNVKKGQKVQRLFNITFVFINCHFKYVYMFCIIYRYNYVVYCSTVKCSFTIHISGTTLSGLHTVSYNYKLNWHLVLPLYFLFAHQNRYLRFRGHLFVARVTLFAAEESSKYVDIHTHVDTTSDTDGMLGCLQETIIMLRTEKPLTVIPSPCLC